MSARRLNCNSPLTSVLSPKGEEGRTVSIPQLGSHITPWRDPYSVTLNVPSALRPNCSGSYMSVAVAPGSSNTPGVVARAMYL